MIKRITIISYVSKSSIGSKGYMRWAPPDRDRCNNCVICGVNDRHLISVSIRYIGACLSLRCVHHAEPTKDHQQTRLSKSEASQVWSGPVCHVKSLLSACSRKCVGTRARLTNGFQRRSIPCNGRDATRQSNVARQRLAHATKNKGCGARSAFEPEYRCWPSFTDK